MHGKKRVRREVENESAVRPERQSAVFENVARHEHEVNVDVSFADSHWLQRILAIVEQVRKN